VRVFVCACVCMCVCVCVCVCDRSPPPTHTTPTLGRHAPAPQALDTEQLRPQLPTPVDKQGGEVTVRPVLNRGRREDAQELDGAELAGDLREARLEEATFLHAGFWVWVLLGYGLGWGVCVSGRGGGVDLEEVGVGCVGYGWMGAP
jgi:hypothetical protein